MKQTRLALNPLDACLLVVFLAASAYTGAQLIQSFQIAVPTDEAVEAQGRHDIEARGLEVELPQASRGPNIAIMEFADFQCSFCAQHAREVLPLINRDFVSTGRVQYVFRHFPLAQVHPASFRAATIASCAGEQGAFWRVHEALFDTIEIVGFSDNRLATGLRLDPAQFEQCVDGQHNAIHLDILAARRMGVRQTPTFFIGRVIADHRFQAVTRINGAASYRDFRLAVDELLEEEKP